MTLFDIVAGTRRCPQCEAPVSLVDSYILLCQGCGWSHADIGAAYVSGRDFEPDRVLDELGALRRAFEREPA